MKLALKAVPYRALQKTTTVAISAVFLTSIGGGFQFGPPLFGLVVAGSFLAMVVYELAYYQRFEYELTEDTLDIRSGVFNRREREIPYGRVQNVDITRNILQRLVGLSAVNIETAGGGSTEASLQYVTAFEAKRLQLDIRRYKQGETPEEHARLDSETEGDRAVERSPEADDEEVLFEIAPSELALAGVLSFDPRVPGAILALFTGSVPFVSPIIPFDAPPFIVLGILGALFAAGVVLAWVVGAASAVVNYWGFRLTRSAEELRYERGLLQRYSGTIPFDKIQAITITDNPLKRKTGYATLVVETAGYAPGQNSGRGSEAAIPIGDRKRVERLASEIDATDDPEFSRPPKRIRQRYLVRYLLGLGAVTGLFYWVASVFAVSGEIPWYLFAGGALLTPVAAHYKWLHRGYWLGEDHLITRNGFWSRETKRVAYYRIQTVIDTRTIFQRRWSVATVIADTAGSLSVLGTGAAAVDIDRRDADRLREELADRLRTAVAERRQTSRRRRSRTADSEPTVSDESTADTGDRDNSGTSGASGTFHKESDDSGTASKEEEAPEPVSTESADSHDSLDGSVSESAAQSDGSDDDQSKE